MRDGLCHAAPTGIARRKGYFMKDERSRKMKSGLEKAPHRSLLYALGLTREEINRPLVGVVNAD